jgi:long-chain acyl-CoA synthetase
MFGSIGEIVTASAQRFGDQTALIVADRQFTFKELDILSNRCANALIGLGVGPGTRVSLYSNNCWEWIVVYYGALKTGAVINPVNAMLTPDEVAFVAKDCGTSMIFTTDDKARAIDGVKEAADVHEIIAFGGDLPDGSLSFDQFIADESDEFKIGDIDTGSLSTICYTSGTTGHPKGAKLSQRAVLLNSAMTALMHGRSSADTVVTALPTAHVYGNVVMNAAIMTGMTLVLHERFEEQPVLESLQRHKATMFEGVPTMYMFLLNHPDLDKCNLSSLRCCTVGGQSMPVAKMEEVESRFECPLIELWGMTEIAGLGTTFAHNGIVKHGSIGAAIPYVQARIAAVDDADKTLNSGEVGELMVRGPIVMQGYFGNDAATAETIEANGWLHTGDLATMDDDSAIFIVDRKKDMILTAGYNVYPAELERVIAAHDDVALVAVGSITDDEKGELAKAYIVPKAGSSPDADDVIEFCRQHLAAYKVPRAVQFVDDLPKTSTGKIMRRELKTLDV